MGYVHLHNRSQYSLLDGAVAPKKLIQHCADLNYGALAITDTCNLYCAVELYKTCKSYNINGILGSEIWMWPEGLSQMDPSSEDGGWNLVFLVENETGYKNLSALITHAIFHGMHYRPRIDYGLLEKHHEGLIVLTSGLNGPLGVGVRKSNLDLGRKHLENLGNIFDRDHLYLELQDYALPLQPELNDFARSLAKEHNLKTVVTNDCRYLKPQDAVTLDLLNCIARGEKIDDPKRLRPVTDQQYFKTEEEMYELFPDDTDALEETVRIAERCHYKFNT